MIRVRAAAAENIKSAAENNFSLCLIQRFIYIKGDI